MFYPNGPGKQFDHVYYDQKHRPLVVGRLTALGMTRYETDQGLSGVAPGSQPIYTAIARLYFTTIAEFQQSMTTHGAELQGDIPNFTNIQPQFQISETL